MNRSTTLRISSSASGTGTRAARPSAIVSVGGPEAISPVRQARSMVGAPVGPTAITSVSGLTDLIHEATPQISEPLPTGTSTWSSRWSDRDSSSAMVAAPSAISASRPSTMSRQPRSRERSSAACLASSKSPSTSSTCAPSPRMRSSLSGFAAAAANTCTSRPCVRPA